MAKHLLGKSMHEGDLGLEALRGEHGARRRHAWSMPGTKVTLSGLEKGSIPWTVSSSVVPWRPTSWCGASGKHIWQQDAQLAQGSKSSCHAWLRHREWRQVANKGDVLRHLDAGVREGLWLGALRNTRGELLPLGTDLVFSLIFCGRRGTEVRSASIPLCHFGLPWCCGAL